MNPVNRRIHKIKFFGPIFSLDIAPNSEILRLDTYDGDNYIRFLSAPSKIEVSRHFEIFSDAGMISEEYTHQGSFKNRKGNMCHVFEYVL